MDEEQLRKVTIGELEPLVHAVQLVEYRRQWPSLFLREAQRIQRILGNCALQIDHVGSTSVSGLSAKPVIDILLVVRDSADEKEYVPKLEAEGYLLRIREPELDEHRMFKGPDTDINRHVPWLKCPEIERMLLFRDWLRINQADRELYESTKRNLSQKKWKYVQDYADAKT